MKLKVLFFSWNILPIWRVEHFDSLYKDIWNLVQVRKHLEEYFFENVTNLIWLILFLQVRIFQEVLYSLVRSRNAITIYYPERIPSLFWPMKMIVVNLSASLVLALFLLENPWNNFFLTDDVVNLFCFSGPGITPAHG